MFELCFASMLHFERCSSNATGRGLSGCSKSGNAQTAAVYDVQLIDQRTDGNRLNTLFELNANSTAVLQFFAPAVLRFPSVYVAGQTSPAGYHRSTDTKRAATPSSLWAFTSHFDQRVGGGLSVQSTSCEIQSEQLLLTRSV